MKRIVHEKFSSRAGKLPRAAAILLALVFIMIAVVSVPVIKHLRDHSREIGCMTALDTADKELRTAYLTSGCSLTYDQAKEAVARAMNGWDDLCPAGGTVHLVYEEGEEMPYRLVCGIHGSDEKERTRLNAQYVFENLTEKVKVYYTANGKYPESVAVSLNGEELASTPPPQKRVCAAEPTTPGITKAPSHSSRSRGKANGRIRSALPKAA